MAELMVPRVDFSTLGNLPQVYREGQRAAREQQIAEARQMTLAELGQSGQIDPMRLIQSGDMSLATLGLQLHQRQQDQARQAQRDSISDARWQQEFALKKRQAAEGGGVYGTPIYGQDENGNIVLGAIGKDGRFRRIDTGGVTPMPGGIKPLDTGAGYVPFDPRRGTTVGPAIPKTGEVSKDYAPVIGPDGAVSAAPIPGSPAAQKIEQEQTKAASRADQTVASGNLVKELIGEVRGKVTSAPFYNPATGFGAGVASSISGTTATDTSELIKTITANIGFDRLQRMREESPTGGALGQVAVQEIEALQKTIGSLGQNQSRGQFLQNLKRIEDQYDRIIRKASAYPNAARYGFGAAGAQSQTGASVPPPPPGFQVVP
jgi:hypothetical protein